MNKSNSHFISKQKIGLNREKCELLNDCDNVDNNQTFAEYTSNNLLRRTSSLENNNDRQQQQRRKRSNEPSTRTTATSSNKEKQRKSVNIQSGQQDIEECLKQLTRENELQKSKLEEQIRLNSVIVANPSLASSLNFSNENNFGCILPTIPSNSSLNNNEIQNFIATEIPLIFSSSTPETSNNNSSTLQKSERSAFSVIRAGSLVGNDKQKEASPSPSTASIPPQLPPIPLELQSSLNPYISTLSTSPFFFPFHSNSQQLEFIRLASQLVPFSLFSQQQQQLYEQQHNNNSIVSSSSDSQQKQLFYEQV
uniref:Uncharacterized protein n=1 Tax=Meloidogyne enterolobii TaxID=390850 RepID=A0A6V7WN30_MELEN|nr:unnamed protein product [Meloidogyne enterolobii]